MKTMDSETTIRPKKNIEMLDMQNHLQSLVSMELVRKRITYLPHVTNTIYPQNLYEPPLRLEGFEVRNRSYQKAERKQTLNVSYKNKSKNTGMFNNSLKQQKLKVEEKLNSSRKRDIPFCLSKSEVASTAKYYCSSSTLHGLKYIGDTNLSLFERFFWIISFTAAVATSILYIWSVYKKWISSPIIISLSPEPVSYEEFPFPSITLCNMNNAKKTEAERINRGSDRIEKLLLDDICNNENDSAFSDLDDESTKWSNVQRFMINISQSCNEMLHYCQWHGMSFDCEKLFNPALTDEGICCNFNSVHRNYLFFNPKDWTDLNVTYPFPIIDWTPEIGYDPNASPDSVPWRPYGAGKYFGLSLALDANVKEYYCSSTGSVGFKMLLHNPVETPKIADFAFAISPGKETRIIIRPHISVASKAILKIPRKKRKCFFTSERQLRFYRTYTQRNCFLECEANFTQHICHCVQYYMPKAFNTSICGKKDDLCAIRAKRAMELKLYDDENINNQLNITETPSCNCWPGCFEVSYSTEISQSTLVSTFNIEDNYLKKDKRYFVENMAVVHLFFVDSQFTKFVKNELFGFTEFLSNIGGLLSLFMGFSVLSFMEIIYFISLRFWCHLRRNKNAIIRSEFNADTIQNNRHITYPFNLLHRVFVYGTLKRDEPNHNLMQNASNGNANFVGLGKTIIKYPLIIATKYNIPFLLKKPGTGHQILGEVYDVDLKMLEKLDELEEHPNFYLRTEEDILLAPESKITSGASFEEIGSLTKAWLYFLPKFKTALLEKQMFSSYSNEGSHGLKYHESSDDFANHETEVD